MEHLQKIATPSTFTCPECQGTGIVTSSVEVKKNKATLRREAEEAEADALQRAHTITGQDVLVELWSRSGERVPGKIRELSRSADPLARTYAARVAFDAGADKAQLGQSHLAALTERYQLVVVPLPERLQQGHGASLFISRRRTRYSPAIKAPINP